jgi:hypothetical protein
MMGMGVVFAIRVVAMFPWPPCLLFVDAPFMVPVMMMLPRHQNTFPRSKKKWVPIVWLLTSRGS